MAHSGELDGKTYRRLLGQFCTGVTVVAGMTDDGPVGFACQAFNALSIDPPMVLFCPAKTSRTWPLLQAAGHFTVNLLSHSQRDVSACFGRPGADKFGNLSWSLAPSGAPVLDGSLGWIDCSVGDVFDGGDHHIVLGRVEKFGEPSADEPLLFFRGSYAQIAAQEPSSDVLTNIITWMKRYDHDELWL